MNTVRKCYNKIYAFNLYERDSWIKALANQIPAQMRVLDVGAGSCPYREYFQHCEYKTHDFAQLQADQLRGGGYGAIDYVSDILSIPVSDASFDVILCTEVLEHTPQPVNVIQEFSRILKPGGRLILTSPLGSGLHQEPYHFYGGFTSYWYKKVLSEQGFKNITINTNGGFFKLFGQECIRFNATLSPRKYTGIVKLLVLIPWAFSLLVRFTFPPLCYFLDRLDAKRSFTVGYHVYAEKGR